MVILLSLCPNQVSLIIATHLTWRYKGNKSESWDHFEEPYLRASVRKENKKRLGWNCLGLNLIWKASNDFVVYACPV